MRAKFVRTFRNQNANTTMVVVVRAAPEHFEVYRWTAGGLPMLVNTFSRELGNEGLAKDAAIDYARELARAS